MPESKGSACDARGAFARFLNLGHRWMKGEPRWCHYCGEHEHPPYDGYGGVPYEVMFSRLNE